MDQPVIFTRFKESDHAELAALYERVMRETFYWFDEARLQEANFDDDTENEFIVVARVGEKLAGFASVWLPDNFIHHLYIDSAFQGMGIGKGLLANVVKRLQGNATLKCLVLNTRAVAFYKNNGWKTLAVSDSDDGEYILFAHTPELTSS
ncbi:GNAT family N-acetyltransferase [Dyadobacter crusticola]|uniref:GNAT family N-acetyltransferase n=1 Tax=Dyadobacter crusticola TaxID=292407 RepID=UPI0004E1D867|nr:GNAT family N-acetyltransferase [Dyadobacter crusticola]